MAKILSENAAGRKHSPQPVEAELCQSTVEVVFPAAVVAINDIVQLVDLPPSVQLVDYTLICDTLGGTPAFSIGVENAAGTDLATVYESALAPSGAVVRCAKPDAMVAGTAGATTRRLSLKATAATTAAAGKKMLVVLQLRG